jgi:hypothetical protein
MILHPEVRAAKDAAHAQRADQHNVIGRFRFPVPHITDH